MYVLPNVDELHYLWLFLSLLGFVNIVMEVGVYYVVNIEVPDNNGMITRFPKQQESFIQIPQNKEGENEDKGLLNSFE